MEKIYWLQLIKKIFLSYPLIYDSGTALKNFVFKGPSWKETQGESVFHSEGHPRDLESLKSLLGHATESLYELGSGHAFNVF